MKGACQLGYMENFEEGSKIAITTREERVVDDRSKANKIVFKGLKEWMACFGSRKNYGEGSNTVTTAPDETVADDRDKANKIVLKQNRQKEYWLPCFGCMDNCGKDGNIVMTASEEALEDDRVKQKKNILEDQKEDDFLSFFSRCAFGYEDPQKYPELQIIAKGIATKLKGSPLAAKAVGGLLQTKFTNEQWTKFLHELPELEEDLTDIMPALSLCYQFLPPPLKWCFAYCSMFPKGYPFNVDNIVNIWISQGFIQPTDSNKIVEDVGREYFDHLVSMSFFELPNYTRSYWKSSYHVMHDLFLDLAKSVVGASECSSYKNKRCFDQTTSHLYIQSWCEHDDVHQWKYFRSVIVNTIHAINFGVLMRIRVLDLSYSCMTELPDCIGDCIYLRYLDLAGNSLHKLPDSLCKLYHLQFLVVPDMCRRLPRRVNSLIKLRYLNASNEAVTRIAGIGSLTSLQELKEFDVKVTKGHDIGQLKELRELRGQLCIRNLGTVKRKEEVIEANLSGKTRIEKLQLKWQRRKAVKVWVDVDEVLECLEPPPNLKELEIHWFGGCRTPSWLEKQSLTLLQSIHLKGCKRWQQLPPLGYLPVLQFLGIDSMDATIDGGDGSVEIFPTLRELWLADASIFLDGISFEDQSRKFFHQLRKLSAVNCKTVKGLPPLSLFSSLEELEIKMCPDLENELPLCLKDLNKLKTLKISTPNLTCFPDEMMQHLKHLEIDTCQNLVSWLVEDKEDALHSSLSSLSVINSPLPTGSILLTSLRELKIDRCSKIRVFTKEQKDWFAYLTSLRNLCITNCMNLVALPPNLHQLGSLEKLTISGCRGLKSLPSDLPNSLRVLEIWNCNQGFTFQYLGQEAPEWIKSIPYKSIAYRKFENVNKDCSLEKVRN
ncbi:disease resistance protein RGA4 [Canna indica]|uniref:Disease resistance protein RGA4 n=1 Tax=Canna indica TaxID=4628 RepID=A0AAQ3L173_9LILI|nr:disease resistance protein RGA4 [Canna indica]